MAGTGRLQADPLFQGLARPTMIMGVSYIYFVLNGFICLILFINLQSFWILFVAAPLVHAIGYLICLREPRQMEHLLIKIGKCTRCRNKRYHHNTNSYDPM